MCVLLESEAVLPLNPYTLTMCVEWDSYPDILLKKYVQLNVNPCLIKWGYPFVSNQPQQVRFNWVPQGCVSSPFLFTLYTNDCVSSQPIKFVVKFSDDNVIFYHKLLSYYK